MNKDFKNLGISFALSSFVDGLSLQRLDMPALNRYVYLIKSKDGKLDYLADLEKDSNNLDTDEVLRDILTYTKDKLSDDKKPLDFSSRKAENESIALVLNLLKSKANEVYQRWTSYTDIKERKLSPEQKQLDELSNNLFGISEVFYNDCNIQSNEFDVIEYMLSTLDIVYGEGIVEPKIINNPIDPEKLTDIFNSFAKDIAEMKEFDKITTNMIDITGQLIDKINNALDDIAKNQEYPYDNMNLDDYYYDQEDSDYDDEYDEENDGEYDDEYEGYDEENEDSDVDNGFEELNDVMSGILDFLNKLGKQSNNNDKNEQTKPYDDNQDKDKGNDGLTKE